MKFELPAESWQKAPAAALASAWEEIPDNEPQRPGEIYRALLNVRMPYPASVGPVKLAITAAFERNRDVRIRGWTIAPPMFTAHSGALAPFVMVMEYEIDPRGASYIQEAGVVNPWVLGAVFAMAVSTFVVLGLLSTRYEKLIRAAGEEAGDALDHLLPVLLISAVMVYLIVGRGGK